MEYIYELSLINSQTFNPSKMYDELTRAISNATLLCLNSNETQAKIKWSRELTEQELQTQSSIIDNHVDDDSLEPKIWSLVSDDLSGLNFHDIDYTTSCNLFPKRTMIKGEVTKVEWYSDEQLTDKVIEVIISYTRDAFGFAQHRTTTRKWVQKNNQFHPNYKVTTKNYSHNRDDQISEGKRRRENIVNSVQLPTLQFMLETMQGTQTAILLAGRNFMDRHSIEFKNFIDNSSSVTDINSPNYGKKNVVVAFESAAATTDTWLNNNPASLGGSTSILQYLVNEFTI